MAPVRTAREAAAYAQGREDALEEAQAKAAAMLEDTTAALGRVRDLLHLAAEFIGREAEILHTKGEGTRRAMATMAQIAAELREVSS